MRSINPETVAGPFATYSHGVEVEASATLLFGAGQTGAAADGKVPAGIEEQSRNVWRNIQTILDEAGYAITDLVQINMLLVDRGDYPTAAAVRGEALGDHRPASTLMYVAGLAREEWRIEIDFIAARTG